MKVNINAEVDVEDLIKSCNTALQKILDNQIHKDCELAKAIWSSVVANKRLLKLMNEEPY